MDAKKLQKTSILAAIFLAGCQNMNMFGGADTYAEVSEQETVVVATAQPIAAPTTNTIKPQTQISKTTVEDDAFINYRETAADYREFGERASYDQNIVSSGGASNMTASIPPTIEEEVTDYEAEINAAVEEANEQIAEEENVIGDDAVEDWLAEEGSTLKGLLTDWSERAGWRLIWNSNRNYTLSAGAMFRGRFADVSSALIRTFARAKPAPTATFYKGNRVLVVETMEDENAYD